MIYYIFLIFLIPISFLSALPSIAGFSEGKEEGSVFTSDKVLVVKSGAKAIIEWDNFDLAEGERVEFIQPHSDSIIINRIQKGVPSHILGAIHSNGQVVFISDEGLVIGSHAEVSVGNLSVLIKKEEDDSSLGSFENHGFIQARCVEIDSEAILHRGKIELLSKLDEESSVGFRSHRGKCAIEGAIQGEFDRLSIHAHDLQIGNKAIMQARHIEIKSEEIVHQGTIEILSKLDELGSVEFYSDRGKCSIEGTVHGEFATLFVSADDLRVSSKALIRAGHVEIKSKEILYRGTIEILSRSDEVGSATFYSRKGKCAIEGTVRGESARFSADAKHLEVSPRALIYLSAGLTGNGGGATLNSDQLTDFRGKLITRGGRELGDGGQVEISSRGELNYKGDVDVGASQGIAGVLLIDPKNITIEEGGEDGASDNTFSSNSSSTVTIDPVSLATALQSGNVVLQANTDIYFVDSLTVSSEDVAYDLTLQAGRSIIIGDSVVIDLAGGSWSATINDENAESENRDDGVAQFSMSGDNVLLTQGGDVTVNVGTFGSSQAGVVSLSSALIDAGGGRIALEGYGSSGSAYTTGISFQDSSVITRSDGSISLTGYGGSESANSLGVLIANRTQSLETVNGNITVAGQGGGDGTGNNNSGIYLTSGSITALGSGTVNLFGVGGSGIDYNQGIFMSGSRTLISAGEGNLSARGTGGGTGTGNHGIRLESGAGFSVSSTGTMDLVGTSGSGSSYSCGCCFAASSIAATTDEGGMTITGDSQASGSQNYGVSCEGSTLSSNSGGMTISGSAGGGDDQNNGVNLSGISTVLTSISGDISITGIGGNGTGNSPGVAIFSAEISSTGSGENGANITIVGSGGSGGDNNDGIVFEGSSAEITSVDGDILLEGSKGSGETSEAVSLQYPDHVFSTGTGTVTIDETS
jgi:filamentous hemagglutinin family protein